MADDAVQPEAQVALGFVSHAQHNTQASPISLRFWARSIGDRNPRFVDESHASAGGAATIAHPCWLYSVHDTAVDVGEPGRVPIIAGTEWEFLRPVRPGDRISTTTRLLAQRRVDSRFAGPSTLQTVGVEYLGDHGELLATALGTLLRVDPEQARHKAKFADWRRWKYSHEELARIEIDYDNEQVRGARPLCLEDVRIGEALPAIVRGPVTSEEMVLFVGGTRPIPAIAEFMQGFAAGTMTGFIHPRTGTYESHAAGLVDDESARQCGFPAAHDYGIDRISQMASLVSNWIGDHGRLLRLGARLLEPCMLGDATWFSGRVLQIEAASPRSGQVTIELSGTNQRGQLTVTGTAAVELPLRQPTWSPAAGWR